MLPTDKTARKEIPIATGVLDYFPLAIAEIAHVSHVGNQQHNPGQKMQWMRHKSTDHADCVARHLIQRGTTDDDGLRHTAKMAWRALALLQVELEAAQGKELDAKEAAILKETNHSKVYLNADGNRELPPGDFTIGPDGQLRLW
jgi:hypothetical protein